jgi:uncharacterized protein (TIGR03086 family)
MTSTNPLSVVAQGGREIIMTRTFNAPRPLVWDALTKPELVSRWLGVFGDYRMATCEIDLRVGGTYRYVWTGPDSFRLAVNGVYREIVAPERLVHTESFEESWYAGEALNTTVLMEQAAPQSVRTTVTTTSLFESQDGRDAVLKSDMEKGVAAGYDALDRVLVAAQAHATVAGRYRLRADRFEQYISAVRSDQWDNSSPCAKWTARDIVQHIIDMHGVMLRPLDRSLSPAPPVSADPLAAFKAARADIEAILADPALAGHEGDTPSGHLTTEQHIDRVPSADMVFHGWDLAKATGQDATMDPDEVQQTWAGLSMMPPEFLEQLRTPGAFGPGIEVFGPEVAVAADASLQDRLLGAVGRDSNWHVS